MENTLHMLKYVSTLLAKRWPDFEVSQFMPHSTIKVPAKIRNRDRNMLLYERMKSLFISTVECCLAKPIAKFYFYHH